MICHGLSLAQISWPVSVMGSLLDEGKSSIIFLSTFTLQTTTFSVPDKNEYNELRILHRVSEGSSEAYALLYRYYLPKLYKYVFLLTQQSKEDTEDLIQEIFLKIWEKRDTLVTISSFENYLFRTARNTLINRHERRLVKDKVMQQARYLQPTSHTRPEQDLLYISYHKTAMEAISQMPAKRQQIFHFSTQQDLSLDEIAEITNLSRAGVKKQLYTAIRFIKDYLKKHAEWIPVLFVSALNKFY